MRPGKGKISRPGHFFLLTSSFYQYNWVSSPPSLVSQMKIARRWEVWGDFMEFFFLILFQTYQDDWKKIINIKLCAVEPLFDLYMYFMYKVRGRKLVCVCWTGGGWGVEGGGRVGMVSGHQGFDI